MGHALQDILDDIRSLEPLPQVAMRVLALSSRDDLVPGELVEVIQIDAGITGKVLKLCNSAYYGFRREIASLPEAGNLLGCSTLVNLVLTACASRYFRDYGRTGGKRARTTWEQAVGTAIACGLLARRRGGMDTSRAYTTGLLQNVGNLVIERFLPEQLEALQAELAAGVPRLEAERNVLGIHHAEIGARLAERWNFPEVLVDTIRHHHTPSEALVDQRLASLAQLAESASMHVHDNKHIDGTELELQNGAFGLFGISPKDYESIEDLLRQEIARARDLIELV